MTIDSALTRGRSRARRRMTSNCTVYRKTNRVAQDESTGREAAVYDVVHTNLPFRLKGGSSRGVTIGGVEFEEATAEGHMPADTFNLADDDLIEITAGEWPGTVWRVVEAVKGDQRTARRVPIVESARPGEWSDGTDGPVDEL